MEVEDVVLTVDVVERLDSWRVRPRNCMVLDRRLPLSIAPPSSSGILVLESRLEHAPAVVTGVNESPDTLDAVRDERRPLEIIRVVEVPCDDAIAVCAMEGLIFGIRPASSLAACASSLDAFTK